MPDPTLLGPEFLSLLLVLLWGTVFLRARRGISRTPIGNPSEAAVEPTCAFVPARDEAEVIERCLTALALQPGLTRLVVVDDQSTDDTPRILESLRPRLPQLRVLNGHGPPPGTCGKPAALEWAFAEEQPNAPWLLFVDADVVLEPGALAGLFELQRHANADLVSILPKLELPTLLEEIVMPAVAGIITARHRPEWVNAADHPTAFANGQLILVRRAVYESIGGHGSVRREVLEDVRLAERVKAAGHRLLIADGRRLARTRMYASFSEMREGWSKNLYLLVGSELSEAVFWSCLAVLLGMAPLVALVLGGLPWGLVAYAVILGFQIHLRRLGGARAGAAVLAPVGALLAAYFLLRSTWLHRKRRKMCTPANPSGKMFSRAELEERVSGQILGARFAHDHVVFDADAPKGLQGVDFGPVDQISMRAVSDRLEQAVDEVEAGFDGEDLPDRDGSGVP